MCRSGTGARGRTCRWPSYPRFPAAKTWTTVRVIKSNSAVWHSTNRGRNTGAPKHNHDPVVAAQPTMSTCPPGVRLCSGPPVSAGSGVGTAGVRLGLALLPEACRLPQEHLPAHLPSTSLWPHHNRGPGEGDRVVCRVTRGTTFLTPGPQALGSLRPSAECHAKSTPRVRLPPLPDALQERRTVRSTLQPTPAQCLAQPKEGCAGWAAEGMPDPLTRSGQCQGDTSYLGLEGPCADPTWAASPPIGRLYLGPP